MWSAFHRTATSANQIALGTIATFLRATQTDRPAAADLTATAILAGDANAIRDTALKIFSEKSDSRHAQATTSLPCTTGPRGERGTTKTSCPRRLSSRISGTMKASSVPFGRQAVM